MAQPPTRGDNPPQTEGPQIGETCGSHNLVGQKLGPKGRDTRERILAAAERLIERLPGSAVTLSAIAREASVGMTTLYLYFGGLGELVLALSEPASRVACARLEGHLRRYWPDAELFGRCLSFIEEYHGVRTAHARLFQLRDSLADGGDALVAEYRRGTAQPIAALLEHQMGLDAADREAAPVAEMAEMAIVLLSGIDRVAALSVQPHHVAAPDAALDRARIVAQARLLELAIREGRARAGQTRDTQ